MFSLVSQKVMSQPPSANKKKQYEIHEILGTGSFGRVMVRARRVYTLKVSIKKSNPFPPTSSSITASDMARTTGTVEP